MVKKSKTTKKAVKTKAVKKKTTAKKKAVTTRKSATGKPSPFKSKLGHDPLSWINGEDAQELGISFDDVKTNESEGISGLDDIIPPSVENIDSDFSRTESDSNNLASNAALTQEPDSVVESVASIHETVSDDGSWGLFGDDDDEATTGVTDVSAKNIADDGSWGLFDDDADSSENTVAVTAAVASDDGSWGLFGDDEDSDSVLTGELPVGEGIAWGLFGDEEDDGVDIDESSASVIHLPTVFNVAEMDAMYHEFERLISAGSDIVVDASETEVIDACGLQLLYASRKELQKRNCNLVVKDASKKVNALSQCSFINEVLGISG